ncbi:hypothetical protein Drorol1_Dr00003205 [Drosera rotundifolia]
MYHPRPTPASSIHPKADMKAAASVQFKPLWRKQQEANKNQFKDNNIRIGQRKSMQLLLVEYSVHPSKIFKQEANDTIKAAVQIFSKSKIICKQPQDDKETSLIIEGDKYKHPLEDQIRSRKQPSNNTTKSKEDKDNQISTPRQETTHSSIS